MALPRPHLSKAPAREALIDIQFEPLIPLNRVERFAVAAAPSFERKSDLLEASFGFGAGGEQTSRQAQIGYRLDNDQTHYVLQPRTNGFTLSRLSPYGQWSDLRDEARKWWSQFYEIARPDVISRLAVRYVNAIQIPLPVVDFGDYLTCPPRLPDGIPQALSGFLQRVVVPDEQARCTSVITQALEGQPTTLGGGAINLLLDIDVFRPTRIDVGSIDEVWAGLDELRDQKNRMFFAHITERTVEMFV